MTKYNKDDVINYKQVARRIFNAINDTGDCSTIERYYTKVKQNIKVEETNICHSKTCRYRKDGKVVIVMDYYTQPYIKAKALEHPYVRQVLEYLRTEKITITYMLPVYYTRDGLPVDAPLPIATLKTTDDTIGLNLLKLNKDMGICKLRNGGWEATTHAGVLQSESEDELIGIYTAFVLLHEYHHLCLWRVGASRHIEDGYKEEILADLLAMDTLIKVLGTRILRTVRIGKLTSVKYLGSPILTTLYNNINVSSRRPESPVEKALRGKLKLADYAEVIDEEDM